jgi:beta-glucanase (GH16 family)
MTKKLALVIAAVSLLAAVQASAQTWKLAWSDEFNGPAGSAPDSSKWTYDLGNNNGWGNGELEFYCAPTSNTSPCSTSTPNIRMDGNGNLTIQAIKTAGGTWTSGRMKTEGLAQFQYGRIEARMKLPVGAGLWPAFWMLGTNIGTAGWPTCGEQDIMEWVPQYTPTTTSSTIHGPGYSGAGGIGAKFTFPTGGRTDDAGFHTYGVIWSVNKIQFYRDDWTKPFFTVTPANIPAGTQWVYNHPFFVLLNLAVGGGFPGPPNSTTPSPATVLVDYVRVYQGWTDSDIGAPGRAGSGSLNGSTFTVTGSGADIWNPSDQFNYFSQSTTGDVTMIARIASQQNTNAWAKAGVMVRETTAANSSFVDVVLTPGNGVSMQYRASTGASAVEVARVTGLTAPRWVKLVRSGNTFTGYDSADGLGWMQLGTINVTMAANVTVGLAVSAHDNTLLSTATFDNVTVQ